MAGTLSLSIPGTTVPNDGAPHVIASQAFAAIAPVNVIAGQDLSGSGFTLRTDAAPSTYPPSGTIAVNALDQIGNGYQVTITYTGTTANGFAGCNVTSGDNQLTTVLAAAQPLITGQVSINRTGAGNHPWLNTLTSATTMSLLIQSSADGGATWQDEAGDTTQGGTITTRQGTLTADTLSVGPINPVANDVRMLATVAATSPSSVFLTGTATVTTR